MFLALPPVFTCGSNKRGDDIYRIPRRRSLNARSLCQQTVAFGICCLKVSLSTLAEDAGLEQHGRRQGAGDKGSE